MRIGYDGRVHKTFHGPTAKVRFDNEVRVLKYLAQQGCDFVPQLLDVDPDSCTMTTTNCGKIAPQISDQKMLALYTALEQYGVRHEDPFPRNITYNPWQGRFNVIDFEFATLLATGEGLRLQDIEIPRGAMDELKALEQRRSRQADASL